MHALTRALGISLFALGLLAVGTEAADKVRVVTTTTDLKALTDITVTTAATIEGRVLARNGAVTLDTNTITRPACATTPTANATSTASPTSTRSAGSGGNTSGGSDLAHTGVNTPLGGLGLALLVTGGGLLMAARSRRPTREHSH
jgi:hypothetical protein